MSEQGFVEIAETPVHIELPGLEELKSLPKEMEELLARHAQGLNVLLIGARRKEQELSRKRAYSPELYSFSEEDVDEYLLPLSLEVAKAARQELGSPEYIGLKPVVIHLSPRNAQKVHNPRMMKNFGDWVRMGHATREFSRGHSTLATIAVLRGKEGSICVLSLDAGGSREAWDKTPLQERLTFLRYLGKWVFEEQEVAPLPLGETFTEPRYLVLTDNSFDPQRKEAVFRIKSRTSTP